MSVPHAVVCHIAEKNKSDEELDSFIELLQQKCNYTLLGGPSYSAVRVHLGTTLVKCVSGDSANDIFQTVLNELERLETGMSKIGCRLTVIAIDSVSEGVFI